MDQAELSEHMLKRQNGNLSTGLQKARRELQDVQQQLAQARETINTRDNALSIYNRQWAQLEEQLALILSQFEGGPQAPMNGDSSHVLAGLSTPVAPLTSTASGLDTALQTRCARMQELGKQFLQLSDRDALPISPDANAAQQERCNALQGKVLLLEDRCSSLSATVEELTARLATANALADKADKDLNRERFKRNGGDESKVPASTAKTEAHTATGASSAPTTGLSSDTGGATAAAAEAAEARAELQVSQKQAQKWLSELEEANKECARARAAEQEMAARPPDESQLRAHPAYKQLHSHVKEMSERAQVAEARLQQCRTDAAALNTMRHNEHNRNEEYRAQHSKLADEEARQKACELATAIADRRTIELQLAQVNANYKREADRAADLEGRLRFATQEHSRAVQESKRLRELVASKESERDAARQAEQAARTALDASELQLASAKATADDDSKMPAGATEKRYHDTVVKLQSAERQAAQAQRDLLALKGSQAALESEIEAVSQTYEEVQAKNDELRQTLIMKEEALSRAKSEKLRADQTVQMLKTEHSALGAKAEKLAALSESVAALRSSYETQLRKSQAASQKKDDEIRAYELLLATQKTQLKEAQVSAQQAAGILRTAQDAESRSKEREERASASAAAEQAHAKRLMAELDAVNRRVARMSSAGKDGSRVSMGGGGDAISEQLEFYRSKVKCTLCRTNDKDAIISKCMHAFCRECIQKRLDVRNRKCPACSLQFDFQSVKDLFLTS